MKIFNKTLLDKGVPDMSTFMMKVLFTGQFFSFFFTEFTHLHFPFMCTKINAHY